MVWGRDHSDSLDRDRGDPRHGSGLQ